MSDKANEFGEKLEALASKYDGEGLSLVVRAGVVTALVAYGMAENLGRRAAAQAFADALAEFEDEMSEGKAKELYDELMGAARKVMELGEEA